MADKQSPPSMGEFDYFDDDAQELGIEALEGASELPESLEQQLQRYREREKRYGRYLVLMTVTFAACIWYLADFRDELAYAFGQSGPPQQLGDVVELTPADIPPNTYVELTGITEHRGITQRKVRGISFMRNEYWYFRLVGSEGVFIETPADKKRYGIATRLSVKGRAIDPASTQEYRRVFEFYKDRYVSKERPELRLIQVGYSPGDSWLGFVIIFVLLSGLLASNLTVLVKLVRARKMASQVFSNK